MKADLSNNVSIYYEEVGKGKPLLIIHGFTLDNRVMKGCMEPVFKQREEKGEKWKRYYIDLPNMGKSVNADNVDNSDKMLETVIEFTEKVLKDKNYSIVGYSYGAYLARGMIYKRVENVDGLMMICPLIIGDETKRALPDRNVLEKDEILAKKVEKECDETEKIVFNDLVIQNPEIWERCKNEIIPAMKSGSPEMLAKIKNNYSFSFEGKINNKFDKPTMIVVGMHDTIVGYKDAMQILPYYSKGIYHTVDGGHALHLEQEEEFNSLVNEWLNALMNG